MESFLEQAHSSAQQVFSILARNVFLQVSALVLQRRIRPRLSQAKKQKQCDDRLDESESKESNEDGGYAHDYEVQVKVSQMDVDLAYDAARKVGEKWITKLLEAGEKELAVVVKAILENGRFLENVTTDEDDHNGTCSHLDFCTSDSSSSPSSVSKQPSQSQNEDAGAHVTNSTEKRACNRNGCRSIEEEGQTNHFGSESGSKTTTHTAPFLALSKLGGQPKQLKPSHNQREDSQNFSTTTTATIGGSEQQCERERLPPSDTNCSEVHYSSGSGSGSGLNHIPEYTKLTEEQLKTALPQGQLFGKPFKTLQEYSDLLNLNCPTEIISMSNGSRIQSVKKQIDYLDSLGSSRCTLWPYDWNVVKNASERNSNNSNRNRIYSHLHSQQALALSGRKRGVPDGDVDADYEQQDNSNSQKELQRERLICDVRVASSLGEMKWSRDHIKNAMTENEKDLLFDEMIHEDGNINSDEKASTKYHKCIGALKISGSFHLWEQMRGGNWNRAKGETDEADHDNHSHSHIQKKRKKEHMKSRRQRFYPNTEIKKARDLANVPSKVSLTESSGKHFLELDLGECMMSLPSGQPSQRRNLIFRSLEIVLNDR